MPGRLAGKRALVTAAGNGIGRATVEAFLAEGAQVFATDIDEDALVRLGGANTFVMDVCNQSAVQTGVAQAAPDVLFNCAGIVHHGSVLDADDAEWSVAFDLNVRSMFWTIKAALWAN